MPLITYNNVHPDVVALVTAQHLQLAPRTPRGPPLLDVLGAAFRHENTIGSIPPPGGGAKFPVMSVIWWGRGKSALTFFFALRRVGLVLLLIFRLAFQTEGLFLQAVDFLGKYDIGQLRANSC